MDTGHASISLAVPQHVEFLAQSLVQRVAESCLEVCGDCVWDVMHALPDLSQLIAYNLLLPLLAAFYPHYHPFVCLSPSFSVHSFLS